MLIRKAILQAGNTVFVTPIGGRTAPQSPSRQNETLIVSLGNGAGNTLMRFSHSMEAGQDLLFLNALEWQAAELSKPGFVRANARVQFLQLGKSYLTPTREDPARGEVALREIEEQVRNALRDYRQVIVITGLGGGTGGAAPLLAEWLRELTPLHTFIAITPFAFEGKRKEELVKERLEKISPSPVIAISNEEAHQTSSSKMSLRDVFEAVDHAVNTEINKLLNITANDQTGCEIETRSSSNSGSILLKISVEDTINSFKGRVDLLRVVLPDGTEKICKSMFEDCVNLTGVEIPDGVVEIGENAFKNCVNLESIVIPDSVMKIHEGAFENCIRLADVTLSEYTWVDGEAFTSTPWLDAMGDFAVVNGCLMQYNGYDDEVTIPDGVKEIASSAFSASLITHVTIPNSVQKIGEWAFSHSDITHVTIPESVTEIEEYAFMNCKELKSIAIPKSVIKINKGAFENCTRLKMVALHEGVQEICESAFKGCQSLTRIFIPKSVNKVDDHAFEAGTKLIRLDETTVY